MATAKSRCKARITLAFWGMYGGTLRKSVLRICRGMDWIQSSQLWDNCCDIRAQMSSESEHRKTRRCDRILSKKPMEGRKNERRFCSVADLSHLTFCFLFHYLFFISLRSSRERHLHRLHLHVAHHLSSSELNLDFAAAVAVRHPLHRSVRSRVVKCQSLAVAYAHKRMMTQYEHRSFERNAPHGASRNEQIKQQ